MMSFSDWLQPYPESGDNRGDTSKNLIGTAFFAHSAKLTAQTAKALGKTEDHEKYENIYKTVAKAFDEKYFDETGKVKGVTETQTAYLLALAFDLLPEEKQKNAQANLLRKLKDADNHLRTGFLGTPLLSQVLDDMGEIDLMYKLLFNETYPSWFYSINQGATTIWERWNSFTKDNTKNSNLNAAMNSFSHYAFGSVAEWMFQYAAGIDEKSNGYRDIIIKPAISNEVQFINGSTETINGKITSNWKIDKRCFYMTIEVPVNTSATIHGDFLYQTEWQRFKKQGVLNRIDLAWSRDQAEKIYVQDRLRQQSHDIWQWLENGAAIYVCGDANHMAKDVEATLIQIISEHGGLGVEAATAKLKELKRNKKYLKDVY